jgi:type VII secretion protein EccB
MACIDPLGGSMPSRQDQLHSYQFMIQRVVAALVMRETDPAQSPFRRAMGATLASALIAAISLGGFAVYGLLKGGAGDDKLREEAAVLVESESGSRFVFREGKLHPVLNVASAMLAAGTPNIKKVSRSALAGFERGYPIGIVDAPDPLPGADQLITTDWTLCNTVVTTVNDKGESESTAHSTLLVGKPAAGGAQLGDGAVLAQDASRTIFLVWRQHRYPIKDQEQMLKFIAGSTKPTLVSDALLNVLDVGAEIGLIRIDDQGAASEGVEGHRIGEVFIVKNQGNELRAVAKRDGLYTITAMQADQLLNDARYGELTGKDGISEMSPGDYDNKFKVRGTLIPTGDTAPPPSTPKLADLSDQGAICAEAKDKTGVSQILVNATAPAAPAPDQATGARTDQGGLEADQVVIAPNTGVLVESVPAPGAAGGTMSVVTDQGRQYALSDPLKVRPMLGYDKVEPMRMPAALVDLIPAGSGLDPDAAVQRVAGG